MTTWTNYLRTHHIDHLITDEPELALADVQKYSTPSDDSLIAFERCFHLVRNIRPHPSPHPHHIERTNQHLKVLASRIRENRNVFYALYCKLTDIWVVQCLVALMTMKLANHLYNIWYAVQRIGNAFLTTPLALYSLMKHHKAFSFTELLFYTGTERPYLQLFTADELKTFCLKSVESIRFLGQLTDNALPDHVFETIVKGSKWIGWVDWKMAVHRGNLKILEVNVELLEIFSQRDMIVEALYYATIVAAIATLFGLFMCGIRCAARRIFFRNISHIKTLE